MPSSPIETLPSSQLNRLKQLLACENISILSQAGGGNSKVYCIKVGDKKWAVKSYPPYAPNQRDRLAAESLAYQFLNENRLAGVPIYKTACLTHRLLIMDWIEGDIPVHYDTTDIDQALNFIRRIAHLSGKPQAAQLPLAAEACLSLNILIEQIQKRFERLMLAAENEQELSEFLTNHFLSIFKESSQKAKDGFDTLNIQWEEELPRTLIPADFGFHNTLRSNDGTLYFFDFDYFGWDDPVKLLSDILWHPKMVLSKDQNEQFIIGMATIYASDSLFLNRFRYTLPLFGLRWVLILLNEFIPAFWQNRQHANVYQDEIAAKKTQLLRAKELLIKVQQVGYDYDFINTTILRD